MARFINIFVSVFTEVVSTLLMVYCVLSWFLPPDNFLREKVSGIMDQFLDPIRRIMPSTGMIDFSPIVLMLILQFVGRIIRMIF